MQRSSTIVALASGPGRAGVAVIRISGPEAGAVLVRMTGGLPRPRMASLRQLVDPRNGEPLDRGLALWFPGPASFTGEDMAELHAHGGRAVVEGVIAALLDGCGCKMAEPGEFARRAFHHGKLDLASVEGLSDLIDAETQAQRRQALRQMDGALGRKAQSWADRLLEALAWAEALLDFSDEGDVPPKSLASIVALTDEVSGEIRSVLSEAHRGEKLRDGFVVVIAGPPNAGKSTLLNALAGRDAAIVSPMAGTTRDVIEVRLELGGLPVTLADVAGIRDSADLIEQEGVRRAMSRMESADLVLWLQAADSQSSARVEAPAGALYVRTKSDLNGNPDSDTEQQKGFVNLSARSGQGMSELRALIEERAAAALGRGEALVTHARQRFALTHVLGHLDRAREGARFGRADELLAEDLRLATRELGKLTGRIDVEDVLGAIFSRFCIGK